MRFEFRKLRCWRSACGNRRALRLDKGPWAPHARRIGANLFMGWGAWLQGETLKGLNGTGHDRGS